MDIREQVLQKYKELSLFLETIDLIQLKKEYTRDELNQFKNEISEIKLRSLSYEIGKLTDQMKKEEYPELLGVHNYPVLKDIDFLSEKEKIDVDNFLVKHIPNRDYVQNIWHVVKTDKKQKLLTQFLLEKGIVEERHVLVCPNCSDNHLSKFLTTKEKEKLQELVQNKADYEDFEAYVSFYCDECGYDFEPEKLEKLYLKTYHKMVMQRDTSFDNV